ncbi:MAG TPA: diadenylate cyclase [Vicinamibacterales bacterium]|nr:diadenylate cyclase [Vicinamibacterales bacterium]
MAQDIESPESLAWSELQRRGSIRERYTRGLREEISAELARCLDPFVHEQDIRPYGAIVARETPHLDRLGRIIETPAVPLDVVRSMADGVHSLVLVAPNEPPRLLLLHERMDTDQDFASHAVWVDGVIVCNDGAGVVRIVTDSSVTLVEGRKWIRKDLVYEAAEDVAQVVPAADPLVVRRLLELSHHRFGPSGVGATLIYVLTDQPDVGHRRNPGIHVDAFQLSVLNEAEEPLLLQQARYRDGALLVGRDGRLLAVNVILRPTRASEHAVPVTRGTRHTSAARHTYDCPDVLAFVVSTDGPVTVFSDGERIADLKTRARPKTLERIAELVAARRTERKGQ